MEKEFVPFELAVKLKELGFNEVCFACYNKDGELNKISEWHPDLRYLQEHPKICLAPLWQQTFEFFREQYRMNPTVISYWQHDWANFSYHYHYQLPDEDNSRAFELYEGKPCRTYEEARLECLKKLIEIIEDEKEN